MTGDQLSARIRSSDEITGLTYGEAMAYQEELDDVRAREEETANEGRTPQTCVAPDGEGGWKVRRSARLGLTR